MIGLVITGTRHPHEVDYLKLVAVLDTWVGRFDKLYVGDANGVDKIARIWAKGLHAFCETFDYKKELGLSGGPARNHEMLSTAISECTRDNVRVLAWPGLTPKGTRDCVRQALEMGVWVKVIGPNGKRLFPR